MASRTSLIFNSNENSTYNHVLDSLNAAGAEVTLQTPPNRIEFKANYCEGEVIIGTLSEGKSNAVIEIKASSIITFGVVVIFFIGSVIPWMMGITNFITFISGGVFGLFLALWLGIVYNPEETLKKIKSAAMQTMPVVSGEAKQSRVLKENQMLDKCQSCGFENREGAKFCGKCGKPLMS